MTTYDNNGQVLRGLPANAVRVQSSLLMLTGKYVDPDGIIYDPDGTINEPATAAFAREVAMLRTGGWAPADFGDFTNYDFRDWYSTIKDDPYTQADVKADSIQQRSDWEAAQAGLEAWQSNVYTTVTGIPGQVVDAVTTTAKTAFSVIQWIVVGLVAYAIIEVSGKREHYKRRIRGEVRRYRRRAASAVAKRIRG
jgi:hypothetical protein